MADTGYNWGSAAHCVDGSGDIDDRAVADNGTVITNEISQDVKASTFIGVKTIEDNTGACDGNVTFYVLAPDADPDSEGFESATDDAPFVGAVIDQAHNKTQRAHFTVPGVVYPKFKVHCLNEAGQGIALTINYYQSTVPMAS